MQPSTRRWPELLGVAVVAGRDLQILLTLLGALFYVATHAAPFGYAYHLGRRGAAGSPTTFAMRLAGAMAVVAIAFGLLSRWGWPMGSSMPLWLELFSTIVYSTTTFVLAGLAGAPLGAIYGRDGVEDERSDDGDGEAASDAATEADPAQNGDAIEGAIRTDF